MKNAVKTVHDGKSERFRNLMFLLLAVLLSSAMVCGMLSGCGSDKKASGNKTPESNVENNSAISDGAVDKIEPASNETVVDEQTETPSAEGGNSESGSNPVDDSGNGGGNALDQTGEDSVQSPPQVDSILKDLRDRAGQTASSIEEISRVASTMQQDVKDLKAALDHQSHTIWILRAVILIQVIVLFVAFVNTIAILVITKNQINTLDGVSDEESNLEVILKALNQAVDKQLQEVTKTPLKDIAHIKESICRVEESLLPAQRTESTSPQKVYFNVMNSADGGQIRLEMTSSTAAPFYALLIDKDHLQYRYELYPTGYPNGTIKKNALYVPSMKGCFDIVPSDMRGGVDSCRISSCVEAIIERESGNMFRLVLKGRLQVG